MPMVIPSMKAIRGTENGLSSIIPAVNERRVNEKAVRNPKERSSGRAEYNESQYRVCLNVFILAILEICEKMP